MRFIFLTAIRVAPEHWIAWRQHISELFLSEASIDGFTCHNGDRLEVLIAPKTSQPVPVDDFGKVIAQLRSQDIFHKELNSLGDNPNNAAHLIQLRTGELCRIDLIEMEAEDVVAEHTDIQERIREGMLALAAQMQLFMPDGLTTNALISYGQTAIHTLMPYDKTDAVQRETVATFFAREGLILDDQISETGPFAPGWSFSALACTDVNDIGLFAAVAMRLQCVWHQQRGQRNFCIDQTALLAKRETVETDITTSHEVVRRLFDFTLWEHQLREFSANLKPWLKTAFDALYQFWDMAEESAYVEKTLKQSHELLASGYQSRILIQERQQSRLLFVIAAVGLLGIIGSLMSIWTALTWGNVVTDSYWASDPGTSILIGLIGMNFAVLAFVLYRFIRTQYR